MIAGAACSGPAEHPANDAPVDSSLPCAPHVLSSADPASGFISAPHEVVQVPTGGGPVVAHPTLVTVTFADDPQRSTYETFGDDIVHSTWLPTVGAEYGVGAGQNVNVELAQDAPPQIDDEDIPDLLLGAISQGAAPPPSSSDAPPTMIYILYFPPTTTVVRQGTDVCATSSGFHSWAAVAADDDLFAIYAVVPACPLEEVPAEVEFSAAHEIIEAATDPYLDTFVLPNAMVSGSGAGKGTELADLCNTPVTEGAYELPSVWSNVAAAAGEPPCKPQHGVFNGLSADACPRSVIPGQSTSFAVTGWSTAPVDPWNIEFTTLPANPSVSFNPGLHWAARTSDNGSTTTLTVTVPPGAPSGSVFSLELVPDAVPGVTSIPFAVAVSVP